MTDETVEPGESLRCMEIRGGNRAEERTLAMPGLDLWVFSQPFEGARSGGDVHYVSLCGGGIISRLIVADVSGHGAPVADFARSLRHFMRRNINEKNQANLVRALNREFGELAQLRNFATVVVATYLTTTNRLSVCNAAHPRPIWFDSTLEIWSVLATDPGREGRSLANLPLGVDDGTDYETFEVDLGRGDIVLFYTDALTEARSPTGTLLGESGLLAILARVGPMDPLTLGVSLLAEIGEYRGGGPSDDDTTLVVLRHHGGPKRKPTMGEKLQVYAKVFGLQDY